MDTNTTGYEYTRSEEFNENLRKQGEFIREYLSHHREDVYYFPYLRGFWGRYLELRAYLASLRNNPDTKDDEDFKELCNYWQSCGNRRIINVLMPVVFKELEARYHKVSVKPVFEQNPFFRELYGIFVKSVYQLFTENTYWRDFFGVD